MDYQNWYPYRRLACLNSVTGQPRPNTKMRKVIDACLDAKAREMQWELVGWITLIALVFGLNMALLGAIINFVIYSPN